MELPDCLSYRPGWVAEPGQAYADLVDQIAWEQHDITIAGRRTAIPRLTSWMGEAAYTYSGVRNEPGPMPALLAGIRQRLQDETGSTFNSCLANLYRDGADSIGYHSDDEPELGPDPTVASISLGARRRFHVRERASGRRWTLELGAGDLLVVSGRSQADYRHAVPKTARPVGPRLNLTFRHFGQHLG